MTRRNAIGALCAAPAALAQQPMTNSIIDLLSGFEPAARDGWRKTRIETPAQWTQRRADIEKRVLDIMGSPPAAIAPLEPRMHGEEDCGSYIRRKISYAGAGSDRVHAWLLEPKKAGQRPGVLAAHPTDPGGKDSVVGLAGKASNHYGKELAERGFLVLAPDSITAGERVLAGSQPYVTEVFDRANPGWSAMGKMLADHRRGLDYLESLLTTGHIGAIGHSLGGYNAFFLAAFDRRVAAAVSSCGFTPLGRASKPFAWARDTWFVHFPKLGSYLRAGIVPFDFHEVLALVAPRPLYNYSAARDAIFPDAAAIREACSQVAAVYKLLGAGEAFVFRMDDGPHEFPEPVRREAYRWLETRL